MKIKKLIYVLVGTLVVASSCSDTEFGNGKEGTGTEPAASSPLVKVYADEKGEHLLAGNILVKEGAPRTITLNVPIHTEKVYMEYNTVSGAVKKTAFTLSPATRSETYPTGAFASETSRIAAVKLSLPEDAVKPTDETDAGYLFYHSTGVAMFEDGWPKQSTWYDKDFNDVVFEYDIKVTECQDEEQMAKQGSKEELLLTLDVRAVGGTYPTRLGVILENLDNKYIDRITAKLVLKGGQGTMRDLGNGVELSAQPSVSVSASGWRWDSDVATVSRFAKLDVDTKPTEGTVITLDGLSSLKDNNDDLFQTTPGKVREGLPMLRAEVRLIGKDNLEGADRTAQLKAFRDLILDTQRQNFFIYTHEGKEIHMRGYQPTSAYKESYAKDAALVSGDEAINENIPYCNKNGFVWGIKVPAGTRHAVEHKAFEEAYPKFSEWAKNNGTLNKGWYLEPDAEKTIRYW